MDKLKMHSPNLTQENMSRIRELFPNCVTEARDEDGKVKLAVDFDLLRQELSESIVEGPQERYRLDWPGKREALLAANAPIAKTLRPCREESVDFDTTKNLYIEGDNLDALKLLQETYLGKVKMIYIDPPYNTGNDFIYEDDFAENTDEFLRRSNQKDEEGNWLVANTESNGRFHSDWLSMMYPRLKLARNLLREDGLLFISIDDNEIANMEKLCSAIFGNENFINHFVWKKNSSGKTVSREFPVNIEYILMFSKSLIYSLMNVYKPLSDSTVATYNRDDKDGRGKYCTVSLQKTKSPGPETTYDYEDNTGKIWSCPSKGWRMIQQKIKSLENDGRLYLDGNTLREKCYWNERENEGQIADTLWDDLPEGNIGTGEVKRLFSSHIFDNPKPIGLIERCLRISSKTECDIILDFFSGSATTAHAVMQLNAEDGGKRQFIMVQLPEPCDEKSEAYKAGYTTIAEIGKERIRRAGAKIKAELDAQQNQNAQASLLAPDTQRNTPLDIGFRVLKVDSSNMADVYYTPDTLNQSMLDMMTDNIKLGRTPEDLLFQVLLDWGVDLTLPIRKETILGKTVFFVDENVLVACFDTGLTEELIKDLARDKPLRVVFRDNGFSSDAVKINATQIFRQLSPGTEVKAI